MFAYSHGNRFLLGVHKFQFYNLSKVIGFGVQHKHEMILSVSLWQNYIFSILSSSLWQKMLALNKYGKTGRETKGQHMIKHYKKCATCMTLFALTMKKKIRKCNRSKYFHQNVNGSKHLGLWKLAEAWQIGRAHV